MATRRITTQEKTYLDQDELRADSGGKSDTSPAVPTNIIVKLLSFTAAMIILPISSYFVSKDWLFKGNATFAGGFAAVVANVVLISYCVVAFQDDKAEREADEAEKKKKKAR